MAQKNKKPGKKTGHEHTHDDSGGAIYDNPNDAQAGKGEDVATDAKTESQQAGAGTRGVEAGAQSQEVGAGTGVTSSQARQSSAGAETSTDSGQAESFTDQNVRKVVGASTFDQFIGSHLARLVSDAEDNRRNSQRFAETLLVDAKKDGDTIRSNAQTHVKDLDSLSVRVASNTNSVNFLGLIEGLKALNDAGLEIVKCKGK